MATPVPARSCPTCVRRGSTSPSTIPGNWFTRAADEGGEQLIIAETGWLATSAAGTLDGTCITPIVHDPVEQAAYFDLLIELANDESIELVTWWSNRDVVVGLIAEARGRDAGIVGIFHDVGVRRAVATGEIGMNVERDAA